MDKFDDSGRFGRGFQGLQAGWFQRDPEVFFLGGQNGSHGTALRPSEVFHLGIVEIGFPGGFTLAVGEGQISSVQQQIQRGTFSFGSSDEHMPSRPIPSMEPEVVSFGPVPKEDIAFPGITADDDEVWRLGDP